MILRAAILSAMLTGAAMAATGPVQAQPVQQQFTPPPPIVPLHSSGGLGSANIGASGGFGGGSYDNVRRSTGRSHGTRYVQTRHGRTVVVAPPLVRGQNSFGDRVTRCLQAGAGAGLGPNQLGSSYIGQCAH